MNRKNSSRIINEKNLIFYYIFFILSYLFNDFEKKKKINNTIFKFAFLHFYLEVIFISLIIL